MAVGLLTDSTAYFPQGEAEAAGIAVVPLYVIFGATTYRDGVDLTQAEFFQRLVDSKELPSTSQPAIGDFEAAYRQLGESTPDVVAIHLSSHLSGTCGTSALAASQLNGNPSVDVVDSKSTSIGQAFVVRDALAAATGGAARSEVAAVARAAAAKVRTYLAIDTLEYLQKGGRVGRTRALLGTALAVKPIIGLDDEGMIHEFAKVRTRKKSLDTLIELAGSRGRPRRIGVVDATTPDDARQVKSRLEAAFPGVPVEFGLAGPVIGVHAGPGMLGVQVQEV